MTMGSYSPIGAGADNKENLEASDEIYILITGTNSGLGLSICRRLIDEFLTSRPNTQSLNLIFTTRSSKKSNETLSQLKAHVQTAFSSQPTTRALDRINFIPEHVDLGDLLSVRALARRLAESTPKLDVLVLNAGIAGFKGLNWFRAVYEVVTDFTHALTWPSSYTLTGTGELTKKQTKSADEPPLGNIFCANIFGHYMLTHYLMPLLNHATPSPGRVVWTSSLEATKDAFDVEDIQCLQTSRAYESCKYLLDILILTSSLPSTSPWVNQFLTSDDKDPIKPKASITSTSTSTGTTPTTTPTPTAPPNMYLAHPGICATSIMPLFLPLVYCMLASCWIARMLGSPWHVLTSHNGAKPAVWISLASQSVLDSAEAIYAKLGGGKVKWGASCDRLGREYIACTEVEGWGFGGVVGGPVLDEDKARRRKRGAQNLTAEQKVEFEELGRRCWREMEEMRVRWEEILSRAEMDV